VSDLPEIDRLEGFPHPRDCTQLLGQHAAETEFLESFNGGRFHHAWLITGTKGVGKASFAYRAAKFLLSQEEGGGLFGPPDTLDTDPSHSAVQLMNAGAHPGLNVLKRQYDVKGKKFFKAIRVDDVRSLSSFFGLKSSDGGWRVVIVDTMDDMNINAANAILKILEEPPKKTIFLLLSNAPAGLLPTIKSRCRRLALDPLPEDVTQQVISPFTGDMSQDALMTLTSLSEGSPGKAAALFNAGGLDAFSGLLSIFGSYPNYDPAKLHGLADLAAKKESEALYRVLCELFPWWLSRFVRAASIGMDKLPLVSGEAEIMQTLLSSKPIPFWIEVWEHANHLIERADTVNLDKKQVILNLFLSATLKR